MLICIYITELNYQIYSQTLLPKTELMSLNSGANVDIFLSISKLGLKLWCCSQTIILWRNILSVAAVTRELLTNIRADKERSPTQRKEMLNQDGNRKVDQPKEKEEIDKHFLRDRLCRSLLPFYRGILNLFIKNLLK